MNKITEKFEQKKLRITELANLFKVTTNEVVQSLKEDGYLYVTSRAKPETIINLKLAGEEYLVNTRATLSEIEDKFSLSRGKLSPYLKQYLGLTLEVRKKVTKFDDSVFDSIDTEEKAYWLGFIYADGTISSSPLIDGKKNDYQLEVSLKLSDIEHLRKIERLFKYDNRVTSDSFRCRFIVNSKHLWKTLNSYGCTPRKSLTLKFPNESIFSSKELIKHFIRGYFDGDGCVSWGNKEHTVLTVQLLGTQSFLTSYLFQCPKEYWDLTLYHNHNNVEEATMFFNLANNKAMRFLDFIYQGSNIYLDRKFNRYKNNCPPSEKSEGK